jgi:hypothetical protein
MKLTEAHLRRIAKVHHDMHAKLAEQNVTLKDRYSGSLVWLKVRDGVVVGAMGSDPKRYLGMTLEVAKHYTRYGGKRR